MPDRLGTLLLQQEVALGHDAEQHAVIVDDWHAADPALDQQLGNLLQRRPGSDRDHGSGHHVANRHHRDHVLSGQVAEADSRPTGAPCVGPSVTWTPAGRPWLAQAGTAAAARTMGISTSVRNSAGPTPSPGPFRYRSCTGPDAWKPFR